MTTPSNSPEEGTPRAGEPVRPAEPTAQPEMATAPGPAVPPDAAVPPPAGPPGPPPWGPAPYPFAPVYRAPRTPWINPARRGHVVAAAIVGALVFGGAGLLVGHAVTDHGSRHGVVRIGPGQGLNDRGIGPGQRPRRQLGPGQRFPNAPAPTAPAPTPTGSPTR